jgi:hypothetical protein
VSILRTVLNLAADRAASIAGVPPENRAEFRDVLVRAIEDELAKRFGGETLKLYFPRLGGMQRKARDERIEAALGAGEAPAVIAKRERISPRWVRKFRGRIGGG